MYANERKWTHKLSEWQKKLLTIEIERARESENWREKKESFSLDKYVGEIQYNDEMEIDIKCECSPDFPRIRDRNELFLMK